MRGEGDAAPSAYHAMGYDDADTMERKAMIVRALAERIEVLGLSPEEAAKCLGVDERWLGRVLRGVFRRVAEEDFVACLERLGKFHSDFAQVGKVAQARL